MPDHPDQRHPDGVIVHDVGETVVDHDRAQRTGIAEVVFGESKTAPQIAAIMVEMAERGHGALATRVDDAKAATVRELAPQIVHHAHARALRIPATARVASVGTACVVCAGTSDLPVAEEAALTLEHLGAVVVRISDVGVAGLHRLLARIDDIRTADVVIVVAGMEGALPSVIAGLVTAPVIGVPTSVGYGVGQGGFAALAGMLTSCAPGLTVVNIDNGFGAAAAAVKMMRVNR